MLMRFDLNHLLVPNPPHVMLLAHDSYPTFFSSAPPDNDIASR
jgi:hypothetical protein